MQIDRESLEVGKSYLATRRGYSFEYEDKMVTFDDVITRFTVLEKPKNVLVDDGPNGEWIEEKLTGDLLRPDWYSVMDLDKNLHIWFCTANVDIEPIIN